MHFVRLAAVLMLLASLAYTAYRAWRGGPGWRAEQVVVISIDTLRADRLGTYGYTARPTSPNLDALARQSVVFEHAYTAAPWTVPALAALLTGRYPVEVGAYTNSDVLADDATTLAELFRGAGYATATFNTHALLVTERAGFRQGFDVVAPEQLAPLEEGEHKASFAAVEADLMGWLAAHARQPFFVWIHDMSPHLPPTAGNPHLSQPGWTRYDAEVRHSDDLIGRVLRRLAELGIGENLLIIVTADHGEAFGDEHGLTGHQDVMYDEVLRVPLIVGAPRFDPRRVTTPVELIDLFPTVAALARLPLPADVRGESLVPLLDGEQPVRRRAEAFHMRFWFEDDEHHWLAVRDREWKLLAKMRDIGRDDRPGWNVDDPATYLELYRFTDDPGELTDLYEQHPDQVQRLTDLLRAWTASLTAAPPRPTVDDATREHLRALGYE